MSNTSGNDINILQPSDPKFVGAGTGNDKYILTSNLASGQQIVIDDALGTNTLQLIDGLTIVSSIVSANAMQLTLSNGAIVTLNGASSFTFEIGGNPLTSVPGTIQDYTTFATTTLGAPSVPATGTVAGAPDVVIGGGTPSTATFSLTTSADSVNEGVADVFTVTASEAVTVDTVVKFKLTASSTAANAGTNLANLNDFNAGSFNEVSVTILAGQTTASTSISAITNDGTELSETYVMTATIGTTVLSKTITILDGAVGAGQTFQLTTGLDIIPGMNGSNGNAATSGNDTIIGVVEVTNAAAPAAGAATTYNSTDMINGGAGTDTLKLVVGGGGATVAADYTLQNNFEGIDILEVQSTALLGTLIDVNALIVNTATVSDLGMLNVTKVSDALEVTAAATTDVNVTVKAAGSTIDVDGGKAVTVNLTGVTDALAVTNSNAITVGAATAAKGAVIVSETGAASVAATDNFLSDITVTGGTTINVTQKATSDASAAAADITGATITQGDVYVTGNASTTEVTVKQDAVVAEVLAKIAVAAKATTQEVSFTKALATDIVTLTFTAGNSLSFEAKKDMTAAEVAAVFANLVNGNVQGSASAELVTYTNVGAGVTAGWSSGAVVPVSATVSKVVFSNANPAAAAITVAAGAGDTVTVVTAAPVAGTAAITAVTGVLGVADGAVVIDDSAAHTIKTITVDAYATASTIGAGTATTVLETLNLSNADATVTMTVADTAATLALNLEKVGTSAADAVLTITAAPPTLNVKSVGNNYVALTAAATETLNVSGTGALKASANDLAALKTVKVTETAGLSLAAAVADTLTSVDTTGTTGTVTASINGATATYTGGAGVDNVSVLDASTAIVKAINLGAGDDKLDLSATTAVVPTAELIGGDGTDTLALNAAAAVALSGAAAFEAKITGFEKLDVGVVGVDSVVNLANLDDINYIITHGAGAGFDLTLDKLVANTTIELTAAHANPVVATLADATGLTDQLNLVTNAANAVNIGTVNADLVETVAIAVRDTDTSSSVSTNTLTLDADAAKTINVSGDGNLVLSFAGTDTKVVTLIDGSSMTGGLTVATLLGDGGATTVKGGSAADTLTAAGTNDILIGGAGNDTLKVAGGAGFVQLTGGAGNDTYDFSTFAPASSGSYASIIGIEKGETIDLISSATANFNATKFVLGSAAGFESYVNQALAAATAAAGSAIDGIAWFQYSGNTYIVQNHNGDATFTAGDLVIELTGLVDLSASSFNDATHGSLVYL